MKSEAQKIKKLYNRGLSFILMGPPGAGKSTQGVYLAQILNGCFLSTGSLLRTAACAGDEKASQIKQILDYGGVVSSSILMPILQTTLNTLDDRCNLILDFGGTIEQCVALEDILQIQNRGLNALIHITVPDNVLKKRLVRRGRQDDSLELIGRRLEIYHHDIQPIMEYYKNKESFLDIYGLGSERNVTDKIIAEILRIGSLRKKFNWQN